MLDRTKQLFRRAGFGLFAGMLALFGFGCGAGKGDVSGRVTYQAKPVTFGTVMIIGTDGLPLYGPIEEDGSYTVTGVPAGPIRIGVNSPDPTTPMYNRDDPQKGRPYPPDEQKRREALKPKWFPIPTKFGDPATSTLTFEVHRGKNQHDIPLE